MEGEAREREQGDRRRVSAAPRSRATSIFKDQLERLRTAIAREGA